MAFWQLSMLRQKIRRGLLIPPYFSAPGTGRVAEGIEIPQLHTIRSDRGDPPSWILGMRGGSLRDQLYFDSVEKGPIPRNRKKYFAHRGDLTHDRSLVNDFLHTKFS
jgi:hypothetical protein